MARARARRRASGRRAPSAIPAAAPPARSGPCAPCRPSRPWDHSAGASRRLGELADHLRQRGVSPFVSDRELRQWIVVLVVEAGPLGVVRAAAAGHFVLLYAFVSCPRATHVDGVPLTVRGLPYASPRVNRAAIWPPPGQHRKTSRFASVLQAASTRRRKISKASAVAYEGR